MHNEYTGTTTWDGVREQASSCQTRRWVPALVLAAAAVLAFLPALDGGFVWDDNHLIVQSEAITGPRGLSRIWFSAQDPDYYPVTRTLWRAQWLLFGDNTVWWHAVNMALHAASAVLLWYVLAALGVPGALFGALLWAVHPVCAESVAWISEQKNTLAMVFGLLSVAAWLRNDEGRRWVWISAGLFALSLLAKPMLAALPAILLAMAWWRKGVVAKRTVIRVLPHAVLAAAFALLTIRYHTVVNVGGDPVRADGLLSRTAVAGKALWFYLYKAVAPVRLSFVYPRWETGATLSDLVPMALFLAAGILFFRYRRTLGRTPLFAWIVYVAALLPILGFFDVYFMRYSLVADHWQYAALAVVCALAGAGLARLPAMGGARVRIASVVAGLVLVSTLFGLSWTRSGVFENEESVWRSVLARHPDVLVARNNLGIILSGQGRYDEAVEQLRAGVATHPDDFFLYYNLGVAEKGRGNLAAARDYLVRSLELEPDYPSAGYFLAVLALEAGDPEAALPMLREVAKRVPNRAEVFNDMGAACWMLGRAEEAVRHFTRATKINPGYVDARYNLGTVLASMGSLDKAGQHLLETLALSARHAGARRNLGVIMEKKGRHYEAARHFSLWARTEPRCAEAHAHLALALFHLGDMDRAQQAWDRAVELDPDAARRFREGRGG
ncbi:MAG: tetratricopeptide repeat protein [Desulfatibacillaceae bacterium]